LSCAQRDWYSVVKETLGTGNCGPSLYPGALRDRVHECAALHVWFAEILSKFAENFFRGVDFSFLRAALF
jgi:hypothetical protein